MPDGLSFDDGIPAFSIPSFDLIVLDMLTLIQPFHGERVIESLRLSKGNFYRDMPRIMERFPKRICISVERGFPLVVGANAFVHQIAAISLTNRDAEFF